MPESSCCKGNWLKTYHSATYHIIHIRIDYNNNPTKQSCSSPVSQRLPVYPATQLQEKSSRRSVHVAPLLHGSGEQSFISKSQQHYNVREVLHTICLIDPIIAMVGLNFVSSYRARDYFQANFKFQLNDRNLCKKVILSYWPAEYFKSYNTPNSILSAHLSYKIAAVS